MMDAQATINRVAEWLDAVASGDWERVWQAHALEAPILVGQVVLPRRHVPVEAFRAQLDKVAQAAPAANPEFRLHEARAVRQDSGRTVVMTRICAVMRSAASSTVAASGSHWRAGRRRWRRTAHWSI